MIANTSGALKRPIKPSAFMPDYLGEKKQGGGMKSLEEQAAEFKAFADKYRSATGQ